MDRQRIGSYRIVQKLGEGGMGTVYEALQEQIGRRVAIKVLHVEHSRNQQIVSRFLNEARAANLIRHPGIVNIHEFGQTPEGASYIVMEFLEGESLRTRLRRLGALGPDALRLGRQLASTLTVAHQKSIVHRDLKPDNVMIVADPETPGGERIKILDFGIAKMTEELGTPGSATPQVKTRTGLIMGTPTYMAPEQCRGSSQVDDRADVYGLGVMLYEMISGRPPYAGDMGELIAMHLFSEPPPLRDVAPWMPAELSMLLSRMLAKAPAERPAMAQVAAELEKLGAKTWESPFLSGAVVTVFRPLTLPLSTLGHTTGQQKTLVPQGPTRRAAAVGGILVVALLCGGMAAVRRYQLVAPNRPPPSSSDPVPAGQTPAPVHWSVNSDPPGASARSDEGREVGVTPFTREQARGKGTLAVTLHLDGFVEKRLVLSSSRDETINERLEPLADLPQVSPPPPSPSPKNGKHHHHQPAQGGHGEPPRPVETEKPVAVAVAKEPTPPPKAPPPVVPQPVEQARPVVPPPVKEPVPRPVKAVPVVKKPEPAIAHPPEPVEKKAVGESAEALIVIGRQRLQGGDVSAAAASFTKARELSPRSAEAVAGLGEVAFEQTNWDEAVKHLRQAVKLAPRHAAYQVLLGQSLYKLGRFKDAADTCRRVLKQDPGLREAQQTLELAEKKLGGAGESH